MPKNKGKVQYSLTHPQYSLILLGVASQSATAEPENMPRPHHHHHHKARRRPAGGNGGKLIIADTSISTGWQEPQTWYQGER